MSKKSCYFKCNPEGCLYGFPPMSYTSYEKYYKWKSVLRKKDQEKGDQYITQCFKLCQSHFEPFYITQNKRLTRHAIPTRNIYPNSEQEEILCAFIQENPGIIRGYNEYDELEKLESKWKELEPKLNSQGPQRTSWAEFLYDLVSTVKTKKVEWRNGSETETPIVNNRDDFTKLELKILEIWKKPESPLPEQLDQTENYEDYEIEMEDSRDSEISKEIVTVMLNIETGGEGPLLQADVAPYEALKENVGNASCKCNHSDDEVPDRFDAFGRTIAKHLRNMPLQTAMETQKLLMSVLQRKQARILNDSFLEN